MYDIVIIGGGAAGLTSVIYALRAGMKTVVFEKLGVGGQIILTEAVENYPGFEMIGGPELMDKFQKHAEKFGAEIRYEEVKKVKRTGKTHVVVTDEGEYETVAVIVATGSQPRKLHVEGEEKFIGRGVSYCAVCDGPFYKGKDVAVIGGGDAAVKEAIYLSQIVKKITIVHRRDKLRAEKIYQDLATSNPKIGFLWNHVVERVNGDAQIDGVTVRGVEDPEKKKDLKVGGVFVYIGHIPNTKFVDVDKTGEGLIRANPCALTTSVPGIYAAGDCRETCLRQIATCVGDGALAAYNAGEYVERFKSQLV